MTRDGVVFTIKGLTEDDVVIRYSARGLASDTLPALPLTTESLANFGISEVDHEQIKEVVKPLCGNFPGGDLESKVGWSWLLERDGPGWKVVAALNGELHSRDAATQVECGTEG